MDPIYVRLLTSFILACKRITKTSKGWRWNFFQGHNIWCSLYEDNWKKKGKDAYNVQILQDWNTCVERTWICRKLNLTAREVQVIWHVLPRCFYHGHQEAYAEIRANSKIFRWKDHVHFFVRRHWMDKERQHRNLFAQRQRRGSIRDLPGACVRNRWWNVNSNEPLKKWDIVALRMFWHFWVSFFHPIFPATEPL